jgi:hypothetical protein
MTEIENYIEATKLAIVDLIEMTDDKDLMIELVRNLSIETVQAYLTSETLSTP